MVVAWSVFDSLTGAFLWYTQDQELATPPLRGEPSPGAWVVVEDPTDSITGLVFVGPPTMYAANYHQFRDPNTFAITVEPLVSSTASAKRGSNKMTASFVEQVLVLRGADPVKAKSKAEKMVARLVTEDDWDHLDD
jgi:hypothetical protein